MAGCQGVIYLPGIDLREIHSEPRQHELKCCIEITDINFVKMRMHQQDREINSVDKVGQAELSTICSLQVWLECVCVGKPEKRIRVF